MKDEFKAVFDALVREGFHQLPDRSPDSGKPFEFKITPYSLNTKLSFKFENLAHFIEFLKLSAIQGDEKILLLNNTFIELGLDPNDFFYVNFYEKGKDAEL
ncbi:hypothetical protein HYN48_04485 [Flavobacterium magnum]|uniref:Uncharacterized protein n=1 Tax=Flavobacterium magnum TaxID=2162713 RepID=A0A2S0RDM9_9FLAO|nr:hypothetical protein [Flavobacterium magnum]AWA29400.1 hypothetical protein HYN48_04485 [Flavobacterium magnum]